MSRERTPAGRPRSFDEAEALDRAVAVFWDHGFGGASYPAIEAATGLHRQSLRYAFGDKAALFRRAMERYAARKTDEMLAALTGAATPLAGLAAAFALWTRDAEHPQGRGCLIVNAMAELGPEDSPAMAAARRASLRLRSGFEAAFRAAQEAGEVRRGLDPAILAAQAVALGDGLIVQGRGGVGPGAAAQVFDAFLTQLRA